MAVDELPGLEKKPLPPTDNLLISQQDVAEAVKHGNLSLSGQSFSCLALENKHSRKVQEKFIRYSSYVGDNIDQMSKGMVSVQFSFEGNCVGTKEVCFVLNLRLRVKTDRWYYRGPESYQGSRNTRPVPKRKR